MRARIAFDTLAYANRLKAAGLDTKIAEVQAEVNADMMANLLDNGLATKHDLIQIQQDLVQVQTHLELKINNTESRLEKQILSVKQEMKELETRLTIRLGAIVLGGFAIFSGFLSIRHMISK